MKKFIISVLFFVLLLALVPSKTQALVFCEGPGDPDCNTPGAGCGTCPGSAPPNICCVPGSGDPACSGQATWTYLHSASCVVTVPSLSNPTCDYQWVPQTCSAVDSCKAQTGLQPGLCDPGGCAIGTTIYKTCCNPGGWAETCNGGDYSGTCPNITKFGSGSSADCVVSGTPPPAPTAPACTPCTWCTNQAQCASVGYAWTSGGCCAVAGDGCCDPVTVPTPTGGCPTCQQCTDCCNPSADLTCGGPIPPRPAALGPWDANCVERKGADFICCVAPGVSGSCRRDKPAANLTGYVTVSGAGRAGPSVQAGKNNGVCTAGGTLTCSGGNKSESCGSDYVGACGGAAGTCSGITSAFTLTRTGGVSPTWQCSHYFARTSVQCWENLDSWDYWCRAANTDGLSYSFGSLVSNTSSGIYTFTLTPPAGYTCTYKFQEIAGGVPTYTRTGTGCTFTNPIALLDEWSGQNVLTWDLVIPPPLACATGFNVSCNPPELKATISWNAIAGAAGYVLRVNKDPFSEWFGAGDIWKEPVNPSQTIDITPAVNYQYDVQGKKPGESSPYSGARCPFAVFNCAPPSPWVKLKNASFGGLNALTNLIPVTINAYDSDDDAAQRYFIMNSVNNDAGLVGAPSVNVGTAAPSSKGWKADYSRMAPFDPTQYLSYIQSRKEYKSISNMSAIINSNINTISGPQTITTTNIGTGPYVLIVQGDAIIDSNINPANPVAIIATGNLRFTTNAVTVSGIFIGGSVTIDARSPADDSGLKVNGNLISLGTFTQNRTRTNYLAPSVFVIFDPDKYLNLLPYLSIAKYDWQQLQ